MDDWFPVGEWLNTLDDRLWLNLVRILHISLGDTGKAMKDREARSNAGRRMAALVGEEEEKDKTFWTADVWDEEEEDSDFSEVEGSLLVEVCSLQQ